MSIEFVVFVVAVVLLIAYRNLGSGAISSAGGNVASGMKTALGWLAGTGSCCWVKSYHTARLGTIPRGSVVL